MAPSRPLWRDRVWLAWCIIHVLVILCIDAPDKLYPPSLWIPPTSPLHFLHRFRQWYIATYNDPLFQWTPERGPSWVPLFFWTEALFQLPAALWGAWKLGFSKDKGTTGGTSGATELLLLVYAFVVAFTTLVVCWDVPSWDASVYTKEMKDVFIYQLFGPWVVVPAIMFADMYIRLYRRVTAVDVVKKKQ